MSGDEAQSKRDNLFRRMDKRWGEINQQRSATHNLRQETAEKYKCLTTQLLGWVSSVQDKVKAASERPLDPEKDFMEVTDILDSIAKEMQDFDAYFKDNCHSLSKYDTGRTQAAANEMRSDYLRLQDRLQPKKKFGFKSKTKAPVKTAEPPQPKKAPPPPLSKEAHGGGYNVTNAGGAPFVDVPEADVRDRDVSLDGLRDCVVRMLGTPSTVHGTNLENVTLLCGPVRTSIFLENCDRCTFVLACQQLRVHATTNSNFYLHVTSKGIIEDSSNVGFAPYNLAYPSLKEHFAESGLDEKRNAWDDIDDFNWLSRGKASPNWHLMPECERQPDWAKQLNA